MTTNVPGTRPVNGPGGPAVGEEVVTPVVTPAGVGGVAVYDRNVDGTPDPALRPSLSTTGEPVPVDTRPNGSILTWIIGAVVLILLAYFLLQMLF
jgi:hypothetical protein